MLCKYYSTYHNALYLVGTQHLIFLIEGIVELAERLDSVQFSRSVASDSATPWTAACQASLSFTNSQSLLKLMYIEPVMPSNRLILSHPLLFLPSIFPIIRVFSSESVLHIRWPEYAWVSVSDPLMNIQDWFPLGWTGLISLLSKGLSRVFCSTTFQKHQFFCVGLLLRLSW